MNWQETFEHNRPITADQVWQLYQDWQWYQFPYDNIYLLIPLLTDDALREFERYVVGLRNQVDASATASEGLWANQFSTDLTNLQSLASHIRDLMASRRQAA